MLHDPDTWVHTCAPEPLNEHMDVTHIGVSLAQACLRRQQALAVDTTAHACQATHVMSSCCHAVHQLFTAKEHTEKHTHQFEHRYRCICARRLAGRGAMIQICVIEIEICRACQGSLEGMS